MNSLDPFNDSSILIVDDSRAICEALTAILHDCGVSNVDYCLNGEEAYTRVERDPTAYDALFVDLHMEGMDGLELMHKLNELRYRGGIIVMSALDKKILDFTLEVISNYNLRVLGSAEKPLERTLIAFMVKRIKSYYPTVSRKEKVLKRRELYEAIKNNKVITYFQPKISAVNNTVVGLECLVRLNMGRAGVISPAAFLPVAERFELIESLTDAVLNTALPQFRRFREHTQLDCSLAINISPLQLYNNLLPETLNEYLNRHLVAKRNVIIEITENHAIREESQLKNLNRMRIHGFQLSLDDYGAGFTNLRQLKNLPFNEIKLDAQMINGIHTDKVLRIMVESVRKVTHEMGLNLVAEGISDSKDLMVISDIGVDAYQGYLFCRPKPMDELLRWHANWEKTVRQTKIVNLNDKHA
ncbi:EAL domain-containing response regulator [Teredinibacter purpureus]|uniref:EAL domain-containing response regulator n=1 Tax=Teredinibacter purpureus TaxID=2731756 RepID=UPI0005F84786|nr:EAL domain-containing response regulator [Teredinibacter purpureus]